MPKSRKTTKRAPKAETLGLNILYAQGLKNRDDVRAFVRGERFECLAYAVRYVLELGFGKNARDGASYIVSDMRALAVAAAGSSEVPLVVDAENGGDASAREYVNLLLTLGAELRRRSDDKFNGTANAAEVLAIAAEISQRALKSAAEQLGREAA